MERGGYPRIYCCGSTTWDTARIAIGLLSTRCFPHCYICTLCRGESKRGAHRRGLPKEAHLRRNRHAHYNHYCGEYGIGPAGVGAQDNYSLPTVRAGAQQLTFASHHQQNMGHRTGIGTLCPRGLYPSSAQCIDAHLSALLSHSSTLPASAVLPPPLHSPTRPIYLAGPPPVGGLSDAIPFSRPVALCAPQYLLAPQQYLLAPQQYL